jgi:thiol-disulfide isomerase/thioredoxin
MARILLLLAGFAIARSPAALAQLPRIGQRAPDFALSTLDGPKGAVRLSTFRGHPVVVSFWASWCPPCRREMPDLAALYEANHPGGLEVLAVNEENLEVDVNGKYVSRSAREHDSALRAFVNASPMPFWILLDQRGDVLMKYGHGKLAIPAMVFVDTAGIVRSVFSNGSVTADSLAIALRTIMPGP